MDFGTVVICMMYVSAFALHIVLQKLFWWLLPHSQKWRYSKLELKIEINKTSTHQELQVKFVFYDATKN